MKVSILICSFGESHWRDLAIRRALPSAQAQKEAHEVRAFHQPDGTLASVRNAAAREATGDVLCYLDADDELCPGYLAAMAEASAGRDGDALYYPAVSHIYGRRVDEPVVPGQGRPLIEINRCVIGTLMPRELFLDQGGFGEEPIYEDWAVFLRLSQHVPLVEVPDAVYRAHVRSDGRNVDRVLAKEWYWRIRKQYEPTKETV